MAGTGSLIGVFRWDDTVEWEPDYIEWAVVFDGGLLEITYRNEYEFHPTIYSEYFEDDGWTKVWP